MGFSCGLKGTGMAFPWHIIRQLNLRNGNLVEDLKLSIDLARKGISTLFCPEAVTTSYFPTTAEAMLSQRIRWEHGHLPLILREVPRLMLVSLVRRNLGIFAFAVNLMIPPLVFIIYLLGVALAITMLAQAFDASSRGLIVLLTATISLLVSVLLVWWRYGRDFLPLQGLGAILPYVLQKFSIYVKFFFDRQKLWVRTDRR